MQPAVRAICLHPQRALRRGIQAERADSGIGVECRSEGAGQLRGAHHAAAFRIHAEDAQGGVEYIRKAIDDQVVFPGRQLDGIGKAHVVGVHPDDVEQAVEFEEVGDEFLVVVIGVVDVALLIHGKGPAAVGEETAGGQVVAAFELQVLVEDLDGHRPLRAAGAAVGRALQGGAGEGTGIHFPAEVLAHAAVRAAAEEVALEPGRAGHLPVAQAELSDEPAEAAAVVAAGHRFACHKTEEVECIFSHGRVIVHIQGIDAFHIPHVVHLPVQPEHLVLGVGPVESQRQQVGHNGVEGIAHHFAGAPVEIAKAGSDLPYIHAGYGGRHVLPLCFPQHIQILIQLEQQPRGWRIQPQAIKKIAPLADEKVAVIPTTSGIQANGSSDLPLPVDLVKHHGVDGGVIDAVDQPLLGGNGGKVGLVHRRIGQLGEFFKVLSCQAKGQAKERDSK